MVPRNTSWSPLIQQTTRQLDKLQSLATFPISFTRSKEKQKEKRKKEVEIKTVEEGNIRNNHRHNMTQPVTCETTTVRIFNFLLHFLFVFACAISSHRSFLISHLYVFVVNKSNFSRFVIPLTYVRCYWIKYLPSSSFFNVMLNCFSFPFALHLFFIIIFFFIFNSLLTFI